MRYLRAASGLRMMLLAQILVIVGSIVTVVGLVLTVVSLGLLFIVPLLGSLVVLAGGGVNILGLLRASADDEGYRSALVFAIISVAASIISLAAQDAALIHTLLTIVCSVLNFLVVNTVCQTTGNLLHSMGNDALSERGNTVSKLYLVCTAVMVVCTLVAAIPILSILAWLASSMSALVALVGYVLYLSFLNGSSKALEA